MNKNGKIILGIFIAIALLVIAIYYFSKDYIPKYKWNESYGYHNNQPYGLKILYDILSGTHSKKDFILIQNEPKKYLNNKDTSSLYIFIGDHFITDSINARAFINFVKRGNHALISSNRSHHMLFSYLTESVHATLYSYQYHDSLLKMSFPKEPVDSVFHFDYRIADKLVFHGWKGFYQSLFADSLSIYGFEPVSHINNGLVDCFRIKCGKGWFIFHFNPILFTNYNLSKEQGMHYVNALLSGYTKPKIYWDEFSKTSMVNTQNSSSHESPLRFILSEKSLRWAWYLICIFILLFVIFNAKRKQALIPLMPVNKNTTIEYITAIATLHYQNNSLEFLAEEMMKQFLSFIRHKYGISPNLDKKEIARQLSLLSGIAQEPLDNLFKRYLDVKYIPEVKYLIEFYNLTEYFYQKCK